MTWLSALGLFLSMFQVTHGIEPVEHPVLFSVNEGLSQSHVNAVEIDQQGFLWVGTEDGLNRYDGYGFRVFRYSPRDSNSLSNNYIYALASDDQGRLYIGTRNGLNVMDPGTGQFSRIELEAPDERSLVENRVFSLLVSRSGRVWIRTGRYLESYNPTSRQVEKYLLPEAACHPGADKPSESMAEGPDGALYLGSETGIFRLVPGTDAITPYPVPGRLINQQRVSALQWMPDSTLLIGTWKGLYSFDTEEGTLRQIGGQGKINRVLSLLAGPENNCWVGTGEGLFLCRSQGTVESFMATSYDGNLLDIAMVYEMALDDASILWVATQYGLVKLDGKPPKFNRYTRSPESYPSLCGLNVSAIMEDRQGFLWVGVYGNGIDVIDRRTKRIVRHYGTKSPAFPIRSDAIRVLFPDRKGNIWLGSHSGPEVCRAGSNQFYPFTEQVLDQAGESLSNKIINAIMEDRYGYLWFATNRGIYRYEPPSGILMKIFPTENPEVTGLQEYTLSLLEDHAGNFWFGTYDGLYRLDLQTAEVRRLNVDSSLDPQDPKGLLILTMVESGDSVLWAGTNQGLYSVDLKAFPLILSKDPTLEGDPLINMILPDDSGAFWISTNNGLVRYRPDTGLQERFDASDGLQSNEFNVRAGFLSARGEMFFGGVLGFNSFFPDSITLNPHVPDVVLTRVDIFSGEGLDTSLLNIPGSIVLLPHHTAFRLQFAALDFTSPGKNMFEYMLDGYDRQWNRIQGRPEVSYTNLPYGRYTFRLRGSNNDQVWNMTGTSIGIRVKTSIFKTRAALAVYILTGLFWIYLLFLLRTRSLRKANQLLKEKELAGLEIARQKEELTIKNKNITDSINYAQKIQEAMLPSAMLFKQILPNSFILFKPKDIVSGDFYWVNRVNDKVFIAAVDCTGHGVPGALMSMIGFELIRNIINVQRIEEPAMILDKLNQGISEAFNKEVERITLKDGMDLSFCAIDTRNNLLQFAGAFNPVYLVRDETITELKGDRISVGLAEDPERDRFRNHIIPIEPSDVIYMFTDGYVDQFGGPREKKFMYRRFRHLLLTIHKLPMEEQKIILEETIEDWKGELDQVDDILVIGLRADALS